MQLLVVGLSHHTAPLPLRERVALGPDELPDALAGLRGVETVDEGLILSTCNRTELYVRSEVVQGAPALRSYLAALRPDVRTELDEHVYQHDGSRAVRHLFRVASGLDSLVVGEHDIARQVRDAYGLACSAGTAGPLLHRAVPRALQVGKRVRSETRIGEGVASVAGAAVQLAGRVFRDPGVCRVLAVGAGRTVETALKALGGGRGGALVVANRDERRARRLADRFGGRGIGLADLHRHVAAADLVVCATAAPTPLVHRDALAPELSGRGARPLLVLDLGVPRDVEPTVADLPGVYLHDVDDLHAITTRSLAQRAEELPRAEAIVTLAVSQFERRRRSFRSEPAVRATLDALLEGRREAVESGKGWSDAERAAADHATGRLVDRLMRRLAPRIKDSPRFADQLLDALGVPRDEPPEDDA